jgi:hypothetical protein
VMFFMARGYHSFTVSVRVATTGVGAVASAVRVPGAGRLLP